MALLKIARLGHPILLQRAGAVADPTAPEVRRLAADMVATMRDAGGIGLAAPQVHVGLRLVLVMPIADRAESFGAEPLVLVNPELEILDATPEEAFEGCLSIPELRGRVPRAARVRWSARDTEGRRVGGDAGGLFARILQHEVDHLDGVLFPMRMTDLRSLAFASELHRVQQAEGGGETA